MVMVVSHHDGSHEVTAGEPPFKVGVRVRPVGTIELDEGTQDLLGHFAPKYIPSLIAVLRTAHRLVEGSAPAPDPDASPARELAHWRYRIGAIEREMEHEKKRGRNVALAGGMDEVLSRFMANKYLLEEARYMAELKSIEVQQ